MADQLATPQDLATLLGEPVAPDLAALLIEAATGVVQAAAGQRIVAVADDTITLLGSADPWLSLPQLPVTAVTTVLIDGQAATHWKRFGGRLWHRHGWLRHHHCHVEPAEVTVTYSHGYADGAQELQLARQATLGLASQAYAAPDGAKSETIDDYRVTYADAAQGALSEPLRAAIRRQYGRRGGWVSLR